MLPRGWWRRFSLRSLLAVVGVCAIGLGTWVPYFQPFYDEQHLLAELQSASLRVVITKEPRGPWWLKNFADGKYAQRVVELQLLQPTDEDLAILVGFRHMTDLGVVHGEGLSDDGLEQIGKLSNLSWLHLEAPHSTDAGLEHLARLVNLRHFFLRSASMTDDGLQHIAKLSELREFGLAAGVTDEGIVALQPLCQLETLRCYAHPNRARTRQTLDSYTMLDFKDVALNDAVEFVSDMHAIPIRIDTDALSRSGDALEQPITIEANNIPLRDGLQQILTPIGLDWCWETRGQNGIVITTRQAAANSRPGIAELQRRLKTLHTVEVDW